MLQQQQNNGGWVTFPFIIVAIMGISMTATGWSANIVVYAIEQYKHEGITAAKLYNIVTGAITFVSVIGAVLADSFFGSFSIFLIASFVSLLTPPCSTVSMVKCNLPSGHQLGFLYSTIALAVVGAGGTGFLLGTIGANQFPTSSEHQRAFFNWFTAAQQLGEVISFTVIVYLQTNVSWGLGFGIGVVANTIAIVAFLSGNSFYRHVKRPQGGSPFTSIARVVVASLRKMNINAPTKDDTSNNSYFYGAPTSSSINQKAPSNVLRAALKIAKKALMMMQMKSENSQNHGAYALIIFGVATSLVVLQALVMDRSMGSHHFKIPAGSMLIFIILSTCLGIFILDRVIHPLMQSIVNRSPTPLETSVLVTSLVWSAQ
ncbi:Protein NRT1/ PTR FAMILY 2.7 [Bienertia sinuspersici]